MTAVPAPDPKGPVSPVGLVALLDEALDAITRYTVASVDLGIPRLGFHDLILLETLRQRSTRLHVTPEQAMLAIMAAKENIYIGGRGGEALWEQFDDEAEALVTTQLALGWSTDGDPDDDGDNTDYDEDGDES